MTEAELQEWKRKIDSMDHEELARLHRFSPPGHPVFNRDNDELYAHFEARFQSFGGMTPAVSKAIGWG